MAEGELWSDFLGFAFVLASERVEGEFRNLRFLL
mgnify:CR=1 FL=1|jgi:hypothetical protein